MKILFLDFASHKKSIGLIDGGETVTIEPIDDHTDESAVMLMVEALLAKMKPDRIAAVTGPGGFMSLRVGIALANALADTLDIPLAGIHLSDLWNARTHTSQLITHNFLWVHSTKQNLLFVRGLGAGAEGWKESTLEKLEDLKAMLASETMYVGELIESQQAAVPMLRKFDDIATLDSVLPGFLDGLTYGKKSLVPWYGRGA